MTTARIAALLLLVAGTLWAKPDWQSVRIPILHPGSALGPLWAGLSGDLYIWTDTQGGVSGDVPTARLLHWDGEKWAVDLTLPGHEPASVFGAGERDVFVSANKSVSGSDRGGVLFRSNDRGKSWTPQPLPAEAKNRRLGRLDGSYENIQVVVDGGSLLRFDGVAWNWCFKGETGAAGETLAINFQSANEGYFVYGRGWGRWIDGAWKFMPMEFGFRDARGLWGLRDRGGVLRLYAIDSHQFSNGVRIWRFNPPMEDFDVEMEESSEDDLGAALGIWGSAQDDIYVIAVIGDGKKPGSGRVYHFDGKSWTRETSMGPIPSPVGITGTSRNDVWITLQNGRLLHYSTATTLTRKMSSSTN